MQDSRLFSAFFRSIVRGPDSVLQPEQAFFGESQQPPPEHVVVFDEAQRAWDWRGMHRKQRVERSEPEMILGVMERAPGWCVLKRPDGGRFRAQFRSDGGQTHPC